MPQAWSAPAVLLSHLSGWATAGFAALATAVVINLPAARASTLGVLVLLTRSVPLVLGPDAVFVRTWMQRFSTSNPQLLRAGKLVSQMLCGPLASTTGSTGSSSGIAVAALDVRKVVLTFSDGSTASFPVTGVSKGRMFGYAIPPRLKVVSSAAYGPDGQFLGSTSIADWKC